MEELNQIQENLETTKLKKKIKTSKEIKQELINKKKEIEKRLKKIELKEAEKRFKKINNLLIKNNNKFTDQDVQDFEEYILTFLEVKNEEKN